MIPVDTDRGPGYTPEERESGNTLGFWFCVQPLRDVLDAPLAQAGVEECRGSQRAFAAVAFALAGSG